MIPADVGHLSPQQSYEENKENCLKHSHAPNQQG